MMRFTASCISLAAITRAKCVSFKQAHVFQQIQYLDNALVPFAG